MTRAIGRYGAAPIHHGLARFGEKRREALGMGA